MLCVFTVPLFAAFGISLGVSFLITLGLTIRRGSRAFLVALRPVMKEMALVPERTVPVSGPLGTNLSRFNRREGLVVFVIFTSVMFAAAIVHVPASAFLLNRSVFTLA